MSFMGPSQRDNTVGRDQAGRDIVNHYHGQETLAWLAKAYEDIAIIDPSLVDTEEYEDDINHYSSTTSTDIRGLERKLIDSGRKDLIETAIRWKEKSSRFIMKYQDSPSAQFIISQILCLIKTRFDTFVRPAIQEGKIRSEIDMLIANQVIAPIQDALKNTPFAKDAQYVNHLVYFLAGNCHICWDEIC